MDGAPKSHPDTHIGKSGGDRVKEQHLALGDLLRSRDRPSRFLATGADVWGEVSGGHSKPPAHRRRRTKGRIRQSRSRLEHSMGVKRQQGSGGQLDLFDEFLKATLRHGAASDPTSPGTAA